ncbi:MAG: hypothetical protein CMH26_02975 [Micavibrio sp.]|mgnify:CR=1 FL=1|nr:hypothetical protein [Micavibrio sp.]
MKDRKDIGGFDFEAYENNAQNNVSLFRDNIPTDLLNNAKDFALDKNPALAQYLGTLSVEDRVAAIKKSVEFMQQTLLKNNQENTPQKSSKLSQQFKSADPLKDSTIDDTLLLALLHQHQSVLNDQNNENGEDLDSIDFQRNFKYEELQEILASYLSDHYIQKGISPISLSDIEADYGHELSDYEFKIVKQQLELNGIELGDDFELKAKEIELKNNPEAVAKIEDPKPEDLNYKPPQQTPNTSFIG